MLRQHDLDWCRISLLLLFGVFWHLQSFLSCWSSPRTSSSGKTRRCRDGWMFSLPGKINRGWITPRRLVLTAVPLCAQKQLFWLEGFKRRLSASSVPFYSHWQIDLESEWPLTNSIRHRCWRQDTANTPPFFLFLKSCVTQKAVTVYHTDECIQIFICSQTLSCGGRALQRQNSGSETWNPRRFLNRPKEAVHDLRRFYWMHFKSTWT